MKGETVLMVAMALCVGIFIGAMYAVSQLPDEAVQQCIPLYDSGMECCK